MASRAQLPAGLAGATIRQVFAAPRLGRGPGTPAPRRWCRQRQQAPGPLRGPGGGGTRAGPRTGWRFLSELGIRGRGHRENGIIGGRSHQATPSLHLRAPPRPGPSGLTRPPCCKGVCPFVPFGNLNAQHQGTEKEMCASLLPRSDKQPWKKYATEESQVPKQYIQHNPTLGSKVEFGLHRLGALQAWSGHFVFSKLGSLISSMAF